MIFADVIYPSHYEEKHDELYSFLKSRFSHVEGGLQCDSWIWVWLGGQKVAVDTFSSMTHQVKSSRSGEHVKEVIAVLRERFELVIYQKPELEAHED